MVKSMFNDDGDDDTAGHVDRRVSITDDARSADGRRSASVASATSEGDDTEGHARAMVLDDEDDDAAGHAVRH